MPSTSDPSPALIALVVFVALLLLTGLGGAAVGYARAKLQLSWADDVLREVQGRL